MHNLRDVLERAQERRVAVGHFNVSDLVLLKAVFAAAQELNVPVVVGASKGERDFLGVRRLRISFGSCGRSSIFRSFSTPTIPTPS